MILKTGHGLNLGIHVVEDTTCSKEWNTLRMWLSNYLLTSADKHVIRYVLPSKNKENEKEAGEQ